MIHVFLESSDVHLKKLILFEKLEYFCILQNNSKSRKLQDFIDNAPNSMSKAKYSAQRERSVGLGVMGFHSLLQSKNISFESTECKILNTKIFQYIHKEVNRASEKIANEKGACPDAKSLNINQRFTHKTAIAPTASISTICNSVSPGIEPYNANAFIQKGLTGSFYIKNPYLENLLEEKGKNNNSTWNIIIHNEGSVSNLECMTQKEKSIFKTAFEINQETLINLASLRGKYVDQSQSLNLFLPADISKSELNKLHYVAWKKNLKSLYYCRSKSLQRADKISKKFEECDICQ